jgi:hypothetical protein
MLLAMGKADLLCRSPRQVSRLAASSRRLRLCWIFLLHLPVKAGMNVGSVSQPDKRKRLRSAYDDSWSKFSLAVSAWQSLHNRTSPGTVSIADAERAVRLAQSQYQQARNALADHLLGGASICRER